MLFAEASNEAPEFDDPGWRDITAYVEIDARRAAIRLTEANIYNSPHMVENPDAMWGNNAIDSYIEGKFWVSVTATIRADRRIEYFRYPAVETFKRYQVCDLGYERFRVRDRSTGQSHIDPQRLETDAEFQTRDDLPALVAYGDEQARGMEKSRAAGTASTFYFTQEYRPGDAISGVAGMGLEFPYWPMVQRVAHLNTEYGVRTQITLTDLRHAPEQR
jgi:hypothetical protein